MANFKELSPEARIIDIFEEMKSWATRSYTELADAIDLNAVKENMASLVEIVGEFFTWNGFQILAEIPEDVMDTREEPEYTWNPCYSMCEAMAEILNLPKDDDSIAGMCTFMYDEIETTTKNESHKCSMQRKQESLRMESKPSVNSIANQLVMDLYDNVPEADYIGDNIIPGKGVALRFDFKNAQCKADAKRFIESQSYASRVSFGKGHSEYAPELKSDWIVISK